MRLPPHSSPIKRSAQETTGGAGVLAASGRLRRREADLAAPTIRKAFRVRFHSRTGRPVLLYGNSASQGPCDCPCCWDIPDEQPLVGGCCDTSGNLTLTYHIPPKSSE